VCFDIFDKFFGNNFLIDRTLDFSFYVFGCLVALVSCELAAAVPVFSIFDFLESGAFAASHVGRVTDF